MKNQKLYLTMVVFTLFLISVKAQELPYEVLPEAPSEFTETTVAARMIDALGFRYYWASKDLRDEDLNYKLNEEGRSMEESLVHIHDLTVIILNSTLKVTNDQKKEVLSYQELRRATLENLKQASDILKESSDLEDFRILFGSSSFPFWNQINGPIADAIWHSGQLAILRRASGNPINPNINHFTGSIKQ